MNTEIIKEIVKGGVAVILSTGVVGVLGFNAWILYNQTELLKINLQQQEVLMERQTIALEEISRTYSGN